MSDGIRWDLLSDAAKGPIVWAALARKMGPQALRMNLNTLLRHGVFNVVFHSVKDADSKPNFRAAKGDNMVNYVAGRIADESAIPNLFRNSANASVSGCDLHAASSKIPCRTSATASAYSEF